MKEIVIKLSDTEYNQLIYGDDGLDYEVLEQAVVNGTPIPDNATTVGDVLDKISNEIEQSRYGLVNDGLDLALKIIDKYTK